VEVRVSHPIFQFTGSNYAQTKDMTTTEIAKLVRDGIKQLKKAGELPAGLKVSVKTDYFSGGSAIRVAIKACPGGAINPEFEAAYAARPNAPLFELPPRYTPACQHAIDALRAVLDSFNRDSSDPMSDYFNRRFWGDVVVDVDE
jgi:hypothetical protein